VHGLNTGCKKEKQKEMKKTLGVCIICKNESEVIEDCLRSVLGADEIVIVDTGSTDNTIEICKKYTKKVYSDAWRDDFSYSRNVSIKKCTTDFFLIIDSDEVLMDPIDRIKKTLNEYWFKYDGMYFEVKTGAETFDSPRVMRNCKEIYYDGAIHNLPTWNGSTPELQTRLYRSAFKIDSGYSPAHNLDPDRTLRILLKELELRPDDTRMMYYLAKEYMNRIQIPETVVVLEKYRLLKYFNPDRWDNELADALYLLALCYADNIVFGSTKWFEAVRTAHESWGVLPTSSDTATLLSELYGYMPNKSKDVGRRQELSYQFWSIIAKNSGNSNVLMKRNFK
jgi:glycosyltransferase involved in cell wall biosynthesis